MDSLYDIKGKNIAITGGAGVLCGSMAKRLSQAGARVSVLDFSIDKARKLCEDINGTGETAFAVEVNVLEKESVHKAIETAHDKMGGIDVLINGAGGNRKEATTSDKLSFFDLSEEAVKQVFDLNFVGTLLPCQIAGKYMAQAGNGVILNISSMNAFRPLTKIPAYSAAKAAISNFTQWLAVHMCRNYSPKIRVNALAPGFFLTEQNRFLLTDENTGDLTPRGKTIIDHTPMARFGSPEDLAGTVLWLVSNASEFVTGIVVPVDGGFSAFSGV